MYYFFLLAIFEISFFSNTNLWINSNEKNIIERVNVIILVLVVVSSYQISNRYTERTNFDAKSLGNNRPKRQRILRFVSFVVDIYHLFPPIYSKKLKKKKKDRPQLSLAANYKPKTFNPLFPFPI